MTISAIDPPHYTSSTTGVECIEITEQLDFCRGNAVKYIWRYEDKGRPIEDLRKSAWYVRRAIVGGVSPLRLAREAVITAFCKAEPDDFRRAVIFLLTTPYADLWAAALEKIEGRIRALEAIDGVAAEN